ncbi:hypothetical protein BDV98DRAFT_583753 [Pterulicium gracile]|uniref:Uncharacterized protein n=1 Tax=Pterulicium gracile TaxID=1884261 RepID=A0A5C3QP53_9AGAR|nr:hypothetical protein BDV98DRAFT_583753 [Pterula gracilis]
MDFTTYKPITTYILPRHKLQRIVHEGSQNSGEKLPLGEGSKPDRGRECVDAEITFASTPPLSTLQLDFTRLSAFNNRDEAAYLATFCTNMLLVHLHSIRTVVLGQDSGRSTKIQSSQSEERRAHLMQAEIALSRILEHRYAWRARGLIGETGSVYEQRGMRGFVPDQYPSGFTYLASRRGDGSVILPALRNRLARLSPKCLVAGPLSSTVESFMARRRPLEWGPCLSRYGGLIPKSKEGLGVAPGWRRLRRSI